LDYAATVEKRIASMTFGKVVRQTLQLNAAGPSSLALCCKRLHQDGKRHDRTYRLLELRLAATYGKAADLEGYPHLRYPTLRDGTRLLNRLEDRRPPNETTALMRAISFGKVEKARSLIAVGAHVNARSYYGDAPLNLAAYKGFRHTVELLHRAGADVNYCRVGGRTPLTGAASVRSLATVAYLLTAKADVNKRDGTGTTPLLEVATTVLLESVAITELLLKAGADRNARTSDGKTALDLVNASSNGWLKDAMLDLLKA
jgi:ankyrin repeat protein